MRIIFSWFMFCVFILYTDVSIAGGEHQRRFAVELALVVSDSRLLAFHELSENKRNWIKKRVTAAINILPLLARYSLQETGQINLVLITKLRNLKKLLDAPEETLYKTVKRITHNNQIQFSLALPKTLPTASKNKIAKRYNTLCLGCHTIPNLDNTVVIGGLGSFARSMSQDEWLARLLGGLHGDAYTGFENPFSDREIAMLFSYTRELSP